MSDPHTLKFFALVRVASAMFILLVAVWATHAGEAELPPSKPCAHILDPLFDFGTLESGAVVEHNFVLENKGNAPLRIKQIRTSCGCTVAKMKSTKIEPGEQSDLRVRFDSGHRVGKQRKTIYLLTNDPETPKIVFRMEGRLTKGPSVSHAEKRPAGDSKRSEIHTKAGHDATVRTDNGIGEQRSEVAEASVSGGEAVAGTRPVLVASQLSWDAGKVRRGERLVHDFPIHNSGTADLVITRLRSSCRCCEVTMPEFSIPAGGTGHIRADFATGGRQGPQRITVDVSSNDPDNTPCKLTFLADVYSPVRTDPSALYFLDVNLGEAATRTAHVLNDEGGPAAAQNLECTLPFVEVAASPSTSAVGVTDISVVLKPDAPVGTFSGYVTLETNDAKDPKRSVRISGRVRGDIAISPSRLFVTRDARSPVALNLRRDLCKQFKVVRAEASEGRVTLKVHAIAEGEFYRVDVVPLDQSVTGRSVSDTVLIYTDCERQSVIEIPVVVKG